ncbi:phytoene desaturase family protein [Gynurincola endophyticus]|uniref:phytoene desaturase family protein n=1 Tax=Gynurincola endophyticus TaxID=2479004 RepID=UPI000F8F0D26|nr:NAD(P)/FAD-dependent oxidoreductase [Gynurincola endophyticus]
MSDLKTDYDAVVVGAGPNGLAAAITIQEQGLNVLLIEATDTIGGGSRTAELTLPGFHHDVCSAIHPMQAASPFFANRDWKRFGLEMILAPIEAAHPQDNGEVACLYNSLDKTIQHLHSDRDAFYELFEPMVNNWAKLQPDVLGPIGFPQHLFPYMNFGLKSIQSAQSIGKRFKSKYTRGLWAGMTAHSMQPLENLSTAAIGIVLTTVGMVHGWAIPKGGSQSIANAMEQYFLSLGGKIQTGTPVKNLGQLPSAKAILFDLTPKQVLEIAGESFSSLYRWQLSKFKYGMGVFKMDFAVDRPVPFINQLCNQASTVHIGGTFEEIQESESDIWKGKHPEKPFVLLAQSSMFDDTRAPEGKHTIWAYCHTPHGSTTDMSVAIENQIERFAPGFRKTILAKNTINSKQLEAYNANYIGGDINGGVLNITQLVNRPALRFSPYKTSAKGMYICSSSTPPGGGVHGQCGFHAAKQALRDLWRIKV